MENHIVEVRLDKRYKNKEGKYPAKLWVYDSSVSKQKRYSIGSIYAFTENEWETLLKAKRGDLKQLRIEINGIEAAANAIIKNLSHFTFEEFEKIMFKGGQKAQRTINFFYEAKIEECKNSNRFGTMVNYESSLKSLQGFAKKETIFFDEITSNWLKKYEFWMTKTEGKSPTTVGIYLRPLRALFRKAIAENVIKEAAYPFGKKDDGRYQIRAPRARKNALSLDELKAFFHSKPETHQQEMAKDFWFFSFYCNGVNLKDIVFLIWENIEDDKLTFKRSKTANSKSENSEITIYLNDRAKEIIEKYGTKDKNKKNFVFPILKQGSTDIELERQKNNFTRFVNQHLKKLFASAGINRSISHGVGRHSFANFALNNNISIEHISEALGHSSPITTQIYLTGFDDDAKKELSNKLNFEL